MTENDIARLTRERDEARERTASLSRELLAAMQARDSYRASAEIRVGMRREFEALLGCGDTMGDNAFAAGLARLRELVAAEKELAEFSEILSRHNHEWSERCELAEARAERLEAVLRESQETLALVLWAHTDAAYPDVGTRATVLGVRAALGEEGK
jgi:hypothetical protein